MSFTEVLLLAVALSMDAFAVAVCKGLSMKNAGVRESATVGAWFGSFQALMPAIGYLLGSAFLSCISRYDHWIVLILLSAIGINMIREALSEEEKQDDSVSFRKMLPLAVATSIDALAAGLTFVLLGAEIISSCLTIGITTFVLSFIGVKLGAVFGEKYQKGAQIAGGAVLIILGLRIFLEHMGIL